jgi:pimeloyl-ACP methyl ester carboxylesterase
MTALLLVHGAAHGRWCWKPVLAELQQREVIANAIDLPAHGDNHCWPWRVTMQTYSDAICEAVRKMNYPVAVLGHSLAGSAIAVAVEQHPELFDKAIFLCALFPTNGMSMLQLCFANGRRPSAFRNGKYSILRGTIEARTSHAREAFFGRLPTEAANHCLARLTPEPFLPFLHKFRLSAERFGRIEKHYIECMADRSISIGHQRWMQTGGNFASVESLFCGHSPFLECPRQLVDAILRILKR